MVTNKRIWFIAIIIVAGLGLGRWQGLTLLSDSKNSLDNTSYITGYFASN